MALNIPQPSFKLTSQDMGAPDYFGSIMGGLNQGIDTYYKGPMSQAQLEKTKSESLKNTAWGDLLKMAMGRNSSSMSGGDSGQQSGSNNQLFPNLSPSANALTAAVLHAQPYVQSPQQEQDIKTNAAIKLKKGETSIDEAKTIRQQSEDLSKTYGYVQELKKILKENPHLTNPASGIAAKLGFGSEAAGRFNALSLKLQAELARQISQRGGKGAAELAALGKTNLYSLPGYNNGILSSLDKDLRSNLGRLAKRHRELTGSNLPYEFKDQNTSMGVNQDGQQVQGSFEKPPQQVGNGKIRVYFPDGPHDIPEQLLNEAISSGATTEPPGR